MADNTTAGSETDRVTELLRGAKRSENDPDIELVLLLSRQVHLEEESIRITLAALVADASED
jgi:hypothetical protein